MTMRAELESKLHNSSFIRSSFGGKDLDTLSEGMQLLREYIFFKGMDFLNICNSYDPLDTGKLTKEKFTEALNKSAFDFREDHINGLIQDAPKGFKDEIQYRDMFFFIKKGKQPERKLTVARLQERAQMVYIDLEPALVRNLEEFWVSKPRFNFKQADLLLLNVANLKAQQKEQGQYRDPSAEVYHNMVVFNNQVVLANFENSIAKEISARLAPRESQALLEQDIQDNFLGFSRIPESHLSHQIEEQEFKQLLTRFAVELTTDETALLYFLIIKEQEVKALTYQVFLNWITRNMKKRRKTPIEVEGITGRNPTKYGASITLYPKILKSIYQLIATTGVSAFIRPLNLLSKNGRVTWEEFMHFLEGSHLVFGVKDVEELKLWLAKQGFLAMDEIQKLDEARIFFKTSEFREYLEEFYKENLAETSGVNQPTALEDAVSKFQIEVYSCYINKIAKRLADFTDSGRMMDELKFRQTVKEMVPTVDNGVVDVLLRNLKYNEEATNRFLYQRIYIDEFISVLNHRAFNPPESVPIIESPRKAQEKSTDAQKETQHSMLKSSLNYEGYINPEQQAEQKPAVLDNVLEKLYTILDKFNQRQSSSTNKTNDRDVDALTIPLVKIFKHADKTESGYLTDALFQDVLMHYFSTLSFEEIRLLTNMGINLTVQEDKQKAAEEGKAYHRKSHINYLYLLVQIEKYLSYKHPERFLAQQYTSSTNTTMGHH